MVKCVRAFGASKSRAEAVLLWQAPQLLRPHHAAGFELGRLAAEMLLWKLQRQKRPAIRAGVPMVLELEGTEAVAGRVARAVSGSVAPPA